MNTLPGNDHARAVEQTPDDGEATVLAILALTFEQRTLALIEYANIADDETADRLWVGHIAPRLGLDEKGSTA